MDDTIKTPLKYRKLLLTRKTSFRENHQGRMLVDSGLLAQEYYVPLKQMSDTVFVVSRYNAVAVTT